MKQQSEFHIMTVGWEQTLVERLCDVVAARSAARFSHVMHPCYVRRDSPDLARRPDIHFFRDHLRQQIGAADTELLASLEHPDVPTIHNMIMSDRIVSRIDHADALRYTSFLARRLIELYGEVQPDAIIGAFDAIHASVALAVARRMKIPWFVLNFSVIPSGLACFGDRMSPAARVQMTAWPAGELRAFAEAALQKFESKNIQAPAYIAPPPPSILRRLSRLPARLSAVVRTQRRARLREHLQFTEGRASYSVAAALRLLRRPRSGTQGNRQNPHPGCASELARTCCSDCTCSPSHPSTSWRRFSAIKCGSSNCCRVRYLPSHKLLVKIHKSDISNHSRAQLERMRAFPGVELVRPFADTRRLIEKAADLVIAIQGTIGLEAALLGKPVIMLGDSPVAIFPSASRVGALADLPALVRRKLAQPVPSREQIVQAYASYLAPFAHASHNDWTLRRTEREIDDYVRLFGTLKQHFATGRQQRV